jgi:hypothetical protein
MLQSSLFVPGWVSLRTGFFDHDTMTPAAACELDLDDEAFSTEFSSLSEQFEVMTTGKD